MISCTHLLTTKPGSSLPMPRTGKSTISCVSSPASKGTPCDAENDRFCGKCGKLDESHVSFLRQISTTLPVFSRLPALLEVNSSCFCMHRRMFYCTVQSRICSNFSSIFVFGRTKIAARRKVGIRTISSVSSAALVILPRCLPPCTRMRCSAGLRLIFYKSVRKALMSDLRSALLCGTVHFIRTFSVHLAGTYRRIPVGCFPNLPSEWSKQRKHGQSYCCKMLIVCPVFWFISWFNRLFWIVAPFRATKRFRKLFIRARPIWFRAI